MNDIETTINNIVKCLQDKTRSKEEKLIHVDEASRLLEKRLSFLLTNLLNEPHRRTSVMRMIFQLIILCLELKHDKSIVQSGILLCSDFPSCRDRVFAAFYNLGVRLLREKRFEEARDQFQCIVRVQDMKKIKNKDILIRSLIGSAEAQLLLGFGSQALTCLSMIQDYDDDDATSTTTENLKMKSIKSLQSRIFLFEASRVVMDKNATNEDLERALHCVFDDDCEGMKTTSYLLRAKILKRLDRDEEARKVVSLALKCAPDNLDVIRTAITLSSVEDQDALSLLRKLQDDEVRLLTIATHSKATNRPALLSETLRLIALSSQGVKFAIRIKALCELATMIVADTTKCSSARRWRELLGMTLEASQNPEDDPVTTNAMRYIIRLTMDHYLHDSEHKNECDEDYVKIPMIAYKIAKNLGNSVDEDSSDEMSRIQFRLLYFATSRALNSSLSPSCDERDEKELAKGKRLREDSCSNMQHLNTLRQLAVKIANFNTEGHIVKSAEFLTLLSQIDLWIFRELASAKRWNEMRIKVETAIGNLDDDHARTFLYDVIDICDDKYASHHSKSELQKFSRDALEMLLKLEHRQVYPNVEAIANVQREICQRSINPVQAFAQAFDTATNLGPFPDISCSWFALRSYNCGIDHALRRKLDGAEKLIKTSLRFLEMCTDDFKSRYLDQINTAYGEVLSLVQKRGDILKNRWSC